MVKGSKHLWAGFSQSLGYLPGLIVLVFALLGIGLVELDRSLDLGDSHYLFAGDGSAARTVLSVVAGSLITVAGLTFSITMVVLQLASSQFSPRTLRNFFGDRITQVTIGSFVGIFVYSMLVLRAVGSFGDEAFVPRLSVSIASLLGIGAVILLVVFLHHVSQMIQVSHVTATIVRSTLSRIEAIYPDRFDPGAGPVSREGLLELWRRDPCASIYADRPGYVQQVAAEELAAGLSGDLERLSIPVCPGDFVSVEQPIAEIWPAEAASDCEQSVRSAVAVADERDLGQDIDFGIRQLADTAIKAMSPGINDPMTAVTCISYLRSVFVRLAERAELEALLGSEPGRPAVIVRRRSFAEQLEPMMQVGRYAAADAWVTGELLDALAAALESARACGAEERARVIRRVATTIGGQARAQAENPDDAARLDVTIAAFGPTTRT